MLRWLRVFGGDREVLNHAFLCSGRYVAKSYQYLDAILRNWWEEELHTTEDIYDQELSNKFENSKYQNHRNLLHQFGILNLTMIDGGD